MLNGSHENDHEEKKAVVVVAVVAGRSRLTSTKTHTFETTDKIKK